MADIFIATARRAGTLRLGGVSASYSGHDT
jgi:hypothetical protein